MNTLEKDYYLILGIPPDASEGDVKKAYRKLAKLYHPDSFKGTKENAEKYFNDITEAYDVLSDPNKRKKYDFLYAEASKEDKMKENSQRVYHSKAADSSYASSPQEQYAENDKESDYNSQSFSTSSMGKPHKQSGRFWRIVIVITIGIICFRRTNGMSWSESLGIWSDIENIFSATDNENIKTAIGNYFAAIQSEDLVTANKYTDDSLSKYNEAVIGLLSSGADSDMYNPLFVTAHSFAYQITGRKTISKKEIVNITITYTDCYEVVTGVIENYDKSYLETLDDTQIADLFTAYLKESGTSVSQEFELTLSKSKGKWKISEIDDIKGFSNAMTGYISRLDELTK